MPDLRLTVDGRVLSGWTGVTVRRGIEQIAGAFELTVSDRPELIAQVRPGSTCVVRIDGAAVINGYVDEVLAVLGWNTHEIQVAGRDATGDLVDCAALQVSTGGGGFAVQPAGQFADRNLLKIAQALCGPFGIPVRAETDVGGPFKTFAVQQGETVFEALDRAARIRGVLLVSDGRGGLVITRAGAWRAPTAVVEGGNLLEARASANWRDRFGRYVVKGQGTGSDTTFAAAAAEPQGVATDKGVGRYRPLLVVAEGPADAAAFGVRADWEASVRFGRALRVEATVAGWTHAGGLWEPNTRVTFTSPTLGIDAVLLIAGVEFTRGERGTRTTLTLVRPEAFDRVPLPEAEAETAFSVPAE